MQKWFSIFREIGIEASKAYLSIYSSEKAMKKFGCGAAGDITRGSDKEIKRYYEEQAITEKKNR